MAAKKTVEQLSKVNIAESILESNISPSDIADEDLADLWSEAYYEAESFLEAIDNIEEYINSFLEYKAELLKEKTAKKDG